MIGVTVDFVRLLRQARVDPEAAARRKVQAFRRFVEEAVATSPFHQERCRRAGLTLRDLRTPDALSALPFMERADVAERLDDITPTTIAPGRCRELRTSGSSGVPLKVRVADRERRVRQALQLRARWLAGRRPLQREAIIGSHVPGGCARYGALSRGLYLSALEPPSEIAAALRNFAPDYLVAFPSTLVELGEESGVTPKLITTGAEVLEPEVRNVLERRFAAPVRDIYGAIETGLLAFQCTAGEGYHLNDDEIHFEYVASDDCASDAPYELVVTTLFARATPLVRYRLGDLVRRLPGRCSCGSWLPRIAAIEGRRDDWLVRPDGGRVPPAAIRALFRQGESLAHYRVIQQADGQVSLQLAGTSGSENAARLPQGLSEIVGRAVTVEVHAQLPRDPSGKRRAICRVTTAAAIAA